VAEEQENGKKQTKKGPLSSSDFQVKKGHCKKAYPNICIICPALAHVVVVVVVVVGVVVV
jgi:hypothetical protein